jgi:Ca2+-binding EF-hand superfamily protein
VAQFKQSFAILDIDRDGELNLQNLLHIYMNVNKKSPLGREVFKLIYYLLDKNIYNKQKHLVEINYEAFLKVTDSKSVIRDEIRRNFLGIQSSVTQMV